MAISKKKAETFSDINITPLTDIFLVLLIIMMVIAPLLDQQGLNLAVPQLGAPPDDKKEFKVITVDVTDKGQISVDGRELNKSNIISTLTELKKDKKDGLVIQADPDAIHQQIVMVMDAARNVGIENVSLMQKQEQQPQK